jgi:hypothetical protein
MPTPADAPSASRIDLREPSARCEYVPLRPGVVHLRRHSRLFLFALGRWHVIDLGRDENPQVEAHFDQAVLPDGSVEGF